MNTVVRHKLEDTLRVAPLVQVRCSLNTVVVEVSSARSGQRTSRSYIIHQVNVDC